MKVSLILCTLFIIYCSGCSSIQETYKPLYQVEPDKIEIEVKKQ